MKSYGVIAEFAGSVTASAVQTANAVFTSDQINASDAIYLAVADTSGELRASFTITPTTTAGIAVTKEGFTFEGRGGNAARTLKWLSQSGTVNYYAALLAIIP